MFTHKSRLTFRLDGNEWRQTNYYEFPDGRVEFHNFGIAPFDENGILHFDNPRILGTSWETNNSICLQWTYKSELGSMLYEIINIIEPGHRVRVWQHARHGVFEGITMIEEWQVAKQDAVPMAHFDQKSYIKMPEAIAQCPLSIF